MKGFILPACLCLLLAAHSVAAQSRSVWTVAAPATNYGRFTYLNNEGIRTGIMVDLVDLVCAEGGMDCRLIHVPPHDCWKSNVATYQSGGRGLFGRWFDACAGWMHTRERDRTFQFSHHFFKGPDAFLYTLKGSRTIDPNNLQRERIGFLIGWFTGEVCLASTSTSFELVEDRIRHYLTADVLLAAMQRGEINAAFGLDRMWTTEQAAQVIKQRTPYACYIEGHGMMSRRDSAFTANWNVGFLKLKNTNKFHKFCDDANKRHEDTSDLPMDCLP